MRIILFISLVFLVACQPTPFFTETEDINPDGWSYKDKVNFSFDISETESPFNMYLLVNHRENFSYQNLYLNITTTFPEKEDTQEKLNIELSDGRGQWVGKCRGGTCQTKVYLIENFKFPNKGTYKFTVEQLSREENLKGINQISLEVFNSPNKPK